MKRILRHYVDINSEQFLQILLQANAVQKIPVLSHLDE